MLDIPLLEAQTRLDELIDRAVAGEEVRIVRHGQAVAVLQPVATPREGTLDLDAIKSATDAMPMQGQSAEDFIRQIRDSNRY